MLDKEELIARLESTSLRELDVLIAKYFYSLEVNIVRVDSKNKNTIRFLYIPPKKKSRHYSKSKSKEEKINDNYRELPRWSFDSRDSFRLLKDANIRFGTITIQIVTENKSTVIIRGEKFSGKLARTIAEAVLYQTFAETEKENDE